MENLNPNNNPAHYHAWFHHKNADGWITLAKKTENGFKQYHYKPTELATELTKWLGEDVYFSQNTFYKPFRRIENIRQLRSLYVDVDCYLLNYEPEWILGKLELEYFKESIPDPNLVIFSGQGLVLIWFIDPVPYKALPLWQSVQNYLVDKLKGLGGDAKAVDAARVFRIAGSVNSKNGQAVTVHYRHDYRYALRDIQADYLPELTPKKGKKGRKPKVLQLHNVYRLHVTRLKDLATLLELRNGDVYGHRELFCFLYRYWSCCVLDDPDEALRQTLEFNKFFKHPLPDREVIRATRSAEKAWAAKNDEHANALAIEKGYPGAGYNLKNSKIIEWLDINPEEQEHLETIIDVSEKNRRKRIANMEKRREEGMKTREQYLKEQYDKTDNKLFNLQQALEENPNITNRELVELLGVSKSRVQQLKRELNKNTN